MFRIRLSPRRTSGRLSATLLPRFQVRFATIHHGRTQGRQKGPLPLNSTNLQTSERYPLSVAVSEVIHPSMEVRKVKGTPRNVMQSSRAVHVRTQIVSPDLCDDVIKYIGHDLDKHKGCDILDVNPGAGVWSQKLHDYLQPRKHVLLEPQPQKFTRFLDPLLTAPGSKYTLVAKDPVDLATYRAMVEEGVFPHQVARDRSDPKAQEPNNTLLVTGSLAWDPILPGLGFDSMPKQLYHHFSSAAWSNDLFHAFGLVRTLLWLQHDDFAPMIAGSASSMQKANRFLEMTHSLNLVVAPERTPRKHGKGSTGREVQYHFESAVRALKSARAAGVEVPEHRRSYMHEFATDMERISDGTGISNITTANQYLYDKHMAGKWTANLLPESSLEIYDMEKHLSEAYPEMDRGRKLLWVPGDKKASAASSHGHPGTKQFSEFYKKRSTWDAVRRTKFEVEAIADVGEHMYNLECQVLEMEDGPEKDAAITELEQLDEQWKSRIAKLNKNYNQAPAHETDERITLRAPPHPRIQWDQRPYEPLVMRNDETWPQNRLCLVSAEPIPKPPGRSADWYEWLQDLVFGLYGTPSDSLIGALDKMQHGLSDIIKDCPSLKNPRKGGRINMHHLRVRVLTMEMIEELVTAYKDWPFKAPESNHNRYFRHKNSRSGAASQLAS